MFGFLGHWTGVQDLDAAGENTGARRSFQMKNYIRRSDFAKSARAFFDIDNVNVVKADRQFLLNSTEIPYNAPNNDVALATNIAFVPITTGGYTFLSVLIPNDNGSARGFAYLSTAALSPVNRKNRWAFYRPDLVDQLAVIVLANNTGLSAASNLISGTVVVDLRQFPNLRSLGLVEGFASNLTIRFNNKLEYFQLQEFTQSLTLSGKLPASCKGAIIGSVAGLTSINTFIEDAVNMESLVCGQWAPFPTLFANPLSTLTGTLELSGLIALKELNLSSSTGLTTINLPSGKSDWRMIYMTILGSGGTGLPTARLDEILASPTLQVFCFFNIAKNWARAFTNADFSSVLVYFWIYQTQFNGNITLSTAKPSIREFKTGNLTLRAGAQQNSHPTVDITGLTNSLTIDLTGSDVDNLQLPVNTVCTQLYLYDNELDIVTNPNLVTQINAMTALVTLHLGLSSTSNVEAAVKGQASTNGIGNNPNLSSLVNLTNLSIASCKATGTLTLANVNKLVGLVLSFNHNLTALANFLSHTSLTTLVAWNCENLVFAITNVFTAINTVLVSDTGITSIDLSGKTTGTMNEFQCSNCDSLTAITFSPTLARMVFGSPRTITGANSASLSAITNMDAVSWNAKTFAINAWDFRNCALNITFPFGANDFCPNAITIQDNSMSQANVDATINSLYTNRTKWNTYSIAKSLNIAGNNYPPSGVYQAPAGFVLGVSDGTPASAKEQLYVLVNNYGWTMTYN